MSSRRDDPAALRVFEPARAIHAFADSIVREARRELVQRVVDAWVEAIPEGGAPRNHYREGARRP